MSNNISFVAVKRSSSPQHNTTEAAVAAAVCPSALTSYHCRRICRWGSREGPLAKVTATLLDYTMSRLLLAHNLIGSSSNYDYYISRQISCCVCIVYVVLTPAAHPEALQWLWDGDRIMIAALAKNRTGRRIMRRSWRRRRRRFMATGMNCILYDIISIRLINYDYTLKHIVSLSLYSVLRGRS